MDGKAAAQRQGRWLDRLRGVAGTLFVLASVLLCAYGDPRQHGSFGLYAMFFCVLIGLAFLVAACVTPFLDQPLVAPEKQTQVLVLLLLVAGLLCLYVGGRWLWPLIE